MNRRGLRPTIGVQCGPSAAAYRPFVDNLKMPPWVGPSWAPMWVNLRGRFTPAPRLRAIVVLTPKRVAEEST